MVITDDLKQFRAAKLRAVSKRSPIPQEKLFGLTHDIYIGLTEASLSEPTDIKYWDDTLTLYVVCICNHPDIRQCTDEIVELLEAELYVNSYCCVTVYQTHAIVDFFMIRRKQFLVGKIDIRP